MKRWFLGGIFLLVFFAAVGAAFLRNLPVKSEGLLFDQAFESSGKKGTVPSVKDDQAWHGESSDPIEQVASLPSGSSIPRSSHVKAASGASVFTPSMPASLFDNVSVSIPGRGQQWAAANEFYSLFYEADRVAECEQAVLDAGFEVVDLHERRLFMIVKASSGQVLDMLKNLPGAVYVDRLYGAGPNYSPTVVRPEMVVRFNEGVHAAQVEALADEMALEIGHVLRGIDGVYLLKLGSSRLRESVLNALSDLVRSPLVAWAEPAVYTKFQKHAVANDEFYPYQWHLHGRDFKGRDTNAHIHVEPAWDVTMGTNTIIVAVLDDSLEYAHPDLAPNMFVNTNETAVTNGVDSDGNGYVDDYRGWDFADDDNDPKPRHGNHNHGTAVAGLIAAVADNTNGVAGIAPNCQLLAVKIGLGMDWSGPDAVAEGILYAAQFADVLNNSWGGSVFQQVIVDAIEEVTENGRNGKGCAVLFSSGNDDAEPNYQATLPMVIAVGGTDHADERVEYSNYGPSLDVVAPTRGGYAGIWTADRSSTNYGYNVVHGWHQYAYTVDVGVHTLRWVFVKNADGDDAWDSAWLDDIALPGGAFEGFESGDLTSWPWTTGGDTNWHVEDFFPYTDTNSVRAGNIGHDDSTYLQLVTNLSGGSVTFRYYVSSERYRDELVFYDNGSNVVEFSGESGSEDGNYTDGFDGTSASCPIASGVAALLLSRYPDLTWAEVRQGLISSADKVGSTPYVNGRNDYYGYGRVNAEKLIVGPTVVSVPYVTGVVGQAYAYDADGFARASGIDTITWYTNSGPSGFTINETNGFVTWTPTAGGWYDFSIRAESVHGVSTQTWQVHVPEEYYLNDSVTAGDVYCTAAGNDGNDGLSPSTPKVTLNALLSTYQLGHGDVVYMDTGRHIMTGDIMITNRGLPGNYIRFQGSTNGTTVLDRNSRVGGTEVLNLENTAYLQFQDFECWNGQYSFFAENIEHCTFDKVVSRYSVGDGIRVVDGSNLVFRQVAVMGARDDGMDLYNLLHSNRIESCTFQDNFDHAVVVTQVDGNDFYFYNNNVSAKGAGNYCLLLDDKYYYGDHNNFFPTNGALVGYFEGDYCTNLTQWQAATAMDSNSVSVDPLFRSTNSYRCYPSSPCANAGTNQNWMTDALDCDDHPRILQGIVDIGADEIADGLLPPTVVITNEGWSVVNGVQRAGIGGTNDWNVFGLMSWTNTATGSNNVLMAFPLWGITNIYLAEGSNVIVVSGTNLVGVHGSDSITIVRGGPGTDPPHVAITGAPAIVSYSTVNVSISGTNNIHVFGRMEWTNLWNGNSGWMPAELAWSNGKIGLSPGTNTIVVYGSNLVGDVTNDSVVIERQQPGYEAPFVDITNENFEVGYDTGIANIHGTNNIHVFGVMWWTNAANGDNDAFAAAQSWTASSIMLEVGTNIITVFGTNKNGDVTNDTIIVTRQGPGYGDPFIMFSTPDTPVSYDITNYTLHGLDNVHIVGSNHWTNKLTGLSGSFPAADNWTLTNMELDVGTNQFLVVGTNLLGIGSTASVLITRGDVGTGQPWVDITNENQSVDGGVTNIGLQGVKNIHTIGTMVWSNRSSGTVGTFGPYTSAQTNWSISSVPLIFGLNEIRIAGTNLWMFTAADTVSVTRLGDRHYVSTNGAHTYPYTNWMTAATNIQAALDAADNGDTVWVSNGVYNTMGRVTPGALLMNRIVVTNALTIRSVNGRAVTHIVGGGPAGTSSYRCAYITNGVILDGFTLRDGNTRTNWTTDFLLDQSGGIVFMAGGGQLTNCAVLNGYSFSSGGGVYCGGGGLIANSYIAGNSNMMNGGGIYFDNGGSLYRSTVESNDAMSGGGLYMGFGGRAENCIIRNNHGSSDGGGVFIDIAGTLRNCLIVTNRGGFQAGGVNMNWGGTLENCTVADNWLDGMFGSGGGIYVQGDAVLSNSIIYYNHAPSETNWNGSFDQGALFVHCSTTPTNANMGGGAGNMTNAPLFANRAAGDYTLQTNSPCVDAGTNQAWHVVATELAGAARLINDIVDIGAYEVQLSGGFTDSDGDGIPDFWELLHSGTATGLTASADNDSDNLDNLEEYRADTDPTNSTSVLAVMAVNMDGTNVEVYWRGGSQAWQYVECNSVLGNTSIPWQVVYSNPPPTAWTGVLIHAGAGTNDHLYYRMKAHR